MSNFTPSNPIENIGALELSRAAVLLSDDSLEASVVSMTAPTSANNCGTIWPCAHRIDDGVLENAAVIVTAGPTIAPCTVMTCPRIDDGALEAATDGFSASPTNSAHSCATSPFYCSPHIDDGELETAAAMIASPSFDTVCTSTIGRRCLRDSAN